MFYVMFQRFKHRQRMFRLMFQHRTNKQIKRKQIKDKKVKDTVSLLTLFSDNAPTLGATKPGRKSTSVVLILKFSANSLCTT